MRLDHALPWTQPLGLTLLSTFERSERRERGPGETVVTEVWPLGRHPPSGLQTGGPSTVWLGPSLQEAGGVDRGQVGVADEEPSS